MGWKMLLIRKWKEREKKKNQLKKMLQLQNVVWYFGGRKQKMYKVWLKESTWRHAAFRNKSSAVHTKAKWRGEEAHSHSLNESFSSNDCYWEKQNRKGCVLIHFRHRHHQSLTLLMNVRRSRWAVTWETCLSIHRCARENGSVSVPFVWNIIWCLILTARLI